MTCLTTSRGDEISILILGAYAIWISDWEALAMMGWNGKYQINCINIEQQHTKQPGYSRLHRL
jgi:hypothetical protein